MATSGVSVRFTVKMPKLGDATQSVVVEAWDVAVGTRVHEGASLMTVETDKVTTEVPCPVQGILVEQLVAVGDEVPVGAPIARVDA